MERAILEQKIEAWCKALEEADKKNWDSEEQAARLGADYFPTYGKKYIRIVRAFCHRRDQGSAFAFVDYEGNIYKPASWQNPAKGARAYIDNPPLNATALYKRGY